jgi:hypothetical protein
MTWQSIGFDKKIPAIAANIDGIGERPERFDWCPLTAPLDIPFALRNRLVLRMDFVVTALGIDFTVALVR